MTILSEITNEELFRKASEWAAGYADEISENEDINKKPKALKYRARAVRQFLTEIERRASYME